MYATTSAALADQAARRARPRPFSSRRMALTPGISRAKRDAMAQVPSVLALSATVTTAGNGKALSK